MGSSDVLVPPFLDQIVEFPDGAAYELLRPLTTFRHCHDGTPAEGRILFTCRRLGHIDLSPEGYIAKIKAQVPSRGSESSADATSSTTTRAELKALGTFRDASSCYAPHLVHYKEAVQGAKGPLPGGYLTFTVMTTMPGDSLHNLYFWGMTTEERAAIVQEFLVALRSIYAIGIEPVDCALRNVLWDKQTQRCTIIDFELWRETAESIKDETKELQRWGLARQPTARNHYEAFEAQFR